MALFQSEHKEVLRRLVAKEYGTTEERDELLAKLIATEGLRARDVVWMLFRPDRAYREAGVQALQRLRDPETVDLFIGECKAKPEAAIRAAAPVLFGLGIPGVEVRLVQLVTSTDKDVQDSVRKLLLEISVSPTTLPVFWPLIAAGRSQDRVAFLAKVGGYPSLDSPGLQRISKLAGDSDRPVRERALEILARRAPDQFTDMLVEQLPLSGYSTQQVLIEALTRVAATQGAEFAGRILPLMASGEASTRSAVLKILLTMKDRSSVVKQYIVFAKSLAGWARDRALDSMKEFGEGLLEPVIDLLSDPDENVRASAISVAASFEDPRIIPATIGLLNDTDWWIRITAVETLGRFKDPRVVEPIIRMLDDMEVRWSAVEALGRVGDPRALPHLAKLLTDTNVDVRIEVLIAIANFAHPQVVPALRRVAETDPSRSVRTRALELVQDVSLRDKKSLVEHEKLRAAATMVRSSAGEPRLHTLLIQTRNSGASDVHLSVDQPPIVRVAANMMRAQGASFTAAETMSMIHEIMSDEQWAVLQEKMQIDFCYYLPNAGRYRANVFLDHRGYNAVFRVIPEKPPTIAEIGLPALLAEVADYHQGLVIVCGPSGSGKSTTLAAFVNLFNETRHDHVLTMEDPVEFVHPFKNCLINQREVGASTQSFARALRAALREDPDVIVIGEMRDNETIELALTAAETGHIVLGTLNSTSAAKAVDRMITSFSVDEQPQIRTALSESLKFVVSQRLLPAKEGRKQVACFEVLRGTSSIANLIRDEKTFQIQSAMQIGRSQGMQTQDDALKDLLRRDLITPETAYMAADKKEDFEGFVSKEFLESSIYNA